MINYLIDNVEMLITFNSFVVLGEEGKVRVAEIQYAAFNSFVVLDKRGYWSIREAGMQLSILL